MLNDESLLRINDVLRRTGLSAPTLYRLIRANAFPRQLREAAACERRGMPAHAASARRLADGHMVGRGLLVPAAIDAEMWSRLARDQQIELADLERKAMA